MSFNNPSALASQFVRALTSMKGLGLGLPAIALVVGLLVLGAGQLPAAPGQLPAALGHDTATLETASLLSIVAKAAPPAGSDKATFSPAQKSAIEQIIQHYLINNPEIMLKVQDALQAKSEKLEAERLKVAVQANAAELFHRKNSAIAGNPKGDVTLVEFFDYNCGFCKRAFTDVAKLVESDKNIRVVFKELPILSKGSEDAARVALAARLQGKYWDVHKALLTARGRASAASALKIAGKLGLDVDKLKKDMGSPAVTAEIEATRKLAQNMGINGTPHFVIGDKVIPGAPQNLLQEITGFAADIRKNGCKVC